jgi:hypothetical protein
MTANIKDKIAITCSRIDFLLQLLPGDIFFFCFNSMDLGLQAKQNISHTKRKSGVDSQKKTSKIIEFFFIHFFLLLNASIRMYTSSIN